VTPEGPRFLIELGELPPEVAKARAAGSKRGPRGLTAGRFAEAGKSIFLAKLFTSFTPLQWAMRAWYFITSGAIWQPRILILGAITMFGWVTSCGTGIAAFKFKSDLFKANDDAEKCRGDLAYANDMGNDVENFAFDQLATKVTNIPAIGIAMKKDPAFLDSVKAACITILGGEAGYGWMYDGSALPEDFAKWRERVEKSDGIDADTKKLLPYLAATRKRVSGQWDLVLDSKDAEMCGRGPLRMTYRQGKNLGLASVGLDGYKAGDATDLTNDTVAMSTLLGQTALAAGEPAPGNLAVVAERVRQGERTCFHVEGDDDRENMSKLLSLFEDQLGKSTKGLPPTDGNFGAVARIAKYFAADVPGLSFADKKTPIDFSRQAPAQALADTPGKQWVLDRTAEVVARALMLPCDAVLNGDKTKMEATFGTLPNPVPCLVLNYKLTHQGGS
jgi:hypothetical protein